MVTSAILYHVMNFFHITIDIRNVCVFLAPLFSSLTTLVTYHLTRELKVGDQLLVYVAFRFDVTLLQMSFKCNDPKKKIKATLRA